MSEIEELEKKANAGNVESMYKLGDAYAFGKSVEADVDKALFWLMKAAKGGHMLSRQVLADLDILVYEKVVVSIFVFYVIGIDVLLRSIFPILGDFCDKYHRDDNWIGLACYVLYMFFSLLISGGVTFIFLCVISIFGKGAHLAILGLLLLFAQLFIPLIFLSQDRVYMCHNFLKLLAPWCYRIK